MQRQSGTETIPVAVILYTAENGEPYTAGGGGGGGDATAANQVLEIAELQDINDQLTAGIAVSGSVSVSNFPATQPISGSVTVTNFPVTQPVSAVDLDIRNLLFASDKVDISGSSSVGVTGPLTDTQLRATPVAVSGTVTTGGLTDTQLRASAVPVSGPLTDTQLRATAVPISGTVTANLAAGTNNIGDVDVLSLPAIPAGNNNIGDVDVVTLPSLPAGTAGGWTPYSLISAGSTNATSVKASAGQIGFIHCININAAVRYLKIYNKASAPTVGSDTPVLRFAIPASATGAGFTLAMPPGCEFTTGIAFALTTGVADSDSGGVAANEITVNMGYK